MAGEGLGKLASGALVYGLGAAAIRMFGILTLPLFTHFLTPADYGVSAILALVSMFITPVFSLGLGTSIGLCYFEHEDALRRRDALWTAAAVLLLSVSVLLVAGTLGAVPLARLAFGQPIHTQLLVVSLLGTAASILSQPFTLALQFTQRARAFVTVSAITSITGICVSVLLIVGLHWGVTGVVVSGAFNQLVNMTLAFGLFWQDGRGEPRTVDRAVASKLLRLGLPMVPAFASLFIIQQANRSMLEWSKGLEAVGLYSVGYSLGMSIALAVNAFSTAWTPYFLSFKTQQQDAPVLFGRATSYALLGFGSLTLLYFVFANPVVSLLTAARFHNAYPVVGPVALSQALMALYGLFLPPVYFADDVKTLNLVQALAAGISIDLDLLLIPPYGAAGAAWALALGVLSMVVAQYLWNLSRGEKYMAIRYEWPRLLLFGVLYLPIAALATVPLPIPTLAKFGVATVAGAGVLGLALAALSRAERQALWRLVEARKARLVGG